MNSIIKNQNNKSVLDKLSAQRNLYDKAKNLRTVRFFMCVVVIICLSVARLIWSNCEAIESALVISTTIALVSGPLLGINIDKRRSLAAQIQQRLDNELYNFSWDDCVCGKEPSDEVIYDYKDDAIEDGLYNWYDDGIGAVEEDNVAILLCQRENVSYDSGLRNWYVTLCAWISIVLSIGVLTLSLVEGWKIMQFLVFGVLPAIPIIEWFVAIFQDNSKDKEQLGQLENLVKGETETVLSGGSVTRKTLIKIQNLLFLHRSKGYLIPSWFYNYKRKKSEKRAAYSIEEFLKKYKP